MALRLTDAELYEITGYKRPSDQARWFRGKGYYVETNARGVPIITQSQIDEKRRINQQNTYQTSDGVNEPNVIAFKARLQHYQAKD